MIIIKKLVELRDSIGGSIESFLGVKIPELGKNFLRTFRNTLAGELKLVYLLLGKIQKNIFVDTAETEADGGSLERYGRVRLGREPFPPVAGQYNVIVTGEAGAVIDAQTTFKSDDDSLSPGILYILDEEHVLISPTDSIIVRALTVGLEGKLNDLDTLTSTQPIPLVESIVTVYAEVVQPLAGETIEEYRQAIIASYQLETQGGSGGDYRLWSQDAQGVRLVYPFITPAKCSQVDLFVEATFANSIDGKGTPSASILQDVEDVVNFDPDVSIDINLRGRRPLQVIVNFLAVSINKIDIEIANYQNLTPEIEALILASLNSLIFDIRPFVASADIIENKNDILDVNRIISSILRVDPGAAFGVVTLKVNGVPVLTVTFLNGNIPNLNSIVYV